jgi:DNA (cytosine-5)-methyltransferase 1
MNNNKIKLFDAFAGIGALHTAFKNIGVETELIGVSEVDPDSIIAYAAIHNINTNDIPLLEETEMKKYLMDKNIGWDFSKQKSSIPRIKKEKLKQLYKASVAMKNYGDVCLLNPNDIEDFDIFNMSFPCTDLSGAGKQKGMTNEDGSITRSGLYIYGINLVKAKKPKYIMIENVKALITKKFIGDFNKIISQIEELGYNCHFHKNDRGLPKCLNAKDYGIPQNRERIFIICVRKDIDDKQFEFPLPFDNGLRLKDFLENEVDEKYYLNKRLVDALNEKGFDETITGICNNPSSREYQGFKEICPTLCARDYKDPKLVQLNTNSPKRLGNIYGKQFGTGYAGNVWDKEAISPTLTTMQGGGREPMILEPNELKFIGGIDTTEKWIETDKELSRNYKEGYRVYDSEGIACCQKTNGGGLGSNTGLYKVNEKSDTINTHSEYVNKKYKEFQEENGYIPEMFNPYNKTELKDYSPTLTAQGDSVTKSSTVLKYDGYRIRKLTPLECYRLMGFSDEAFYKAKSVGISDSQLYKQAGNSIVVNVLEEIFKKLFNT